MSEQLQNLAGQLINPATEDTLATRASESTLAAVKANSDKLTFASGNLNIVDNTPVVEYFFDRILNQKFHDNEKLYVDSSDTSKSNLLEYFGLADDTAAETDPIWAVVRVEYDANGVIFRKRIKLNIKWADRATAWS